MRSRQRSGLLGEETRAQASRRRALPCTPDAAMSNAVACCRAAATHRATCRSSTAHQTPRGPAPGAHRRWIQGGARRGGPKLEAREGEGCAGESHGEQWPWPPDPPRSSSAPWPLPHRGSLAEERKGRARDSPGQGRCARSQPQPGGPAAPRQGGGRARGGEADEDGAWYMCVAYSTLAPLAPCKQLGRRGGGGVWRMRRGSGI